MCFFNEKNKNPIENFNGYFIAFSVFYQITSKIFVRFRITGFCAILLFVRGGSSVWRATQTSSSWGSLETSPLWQLLSRTRLRVCSSFPMAEGQEIAFRADSIQVLFGLG